MTVGIILAGGRGSRLGPLAAQISKALVSIGQRPHLAHQIELLRGNGCEQIIVVTSPDTDSQIRQVIDRADIEDVTTIVQERPLGPSQAVLLGACAAAVHDTQSDLLVLMSDTFLPADTVFPDGDWYGIAPVPSERSFCYWDGESAYVDGVPPDGSSVTIGAYRFTSILHATTAIVDAMMSHVGEAEVGMSSFLTTYAVKNTPEHVDFGDSWLDIGDVMALARARRKAFIARDSHSLELTAMNTIVKRGKGDGFLMQHSWMSAMNQNKSTRHLVPRVYDVAEDSYSMEYIDLPTLSELWLYWPGRSDTWQQILESIIAELDSSLWTSEKPWYTDDGSDIFVGKAIARLASLGLPNDHPLFAMLFDVKCFFNEMEYVRAHGDLNWNNILFSLNTGGFKLIDPRGNDSLPLAYELTKLSYSWNGFAHITHNLAFDRATTRVRERDALNEVLSDYMSSIGRTAAEGCLFLAGAPLHPPAQRERMIALGTEKLKEAIDG